MSGPWPLVPLGEVLQLQRRWLKLDPLADYVEIGIRSFGKGIFHKPPVAGSSLGEKRVLRIVPGDLVFNNVFAWEGAVAVAGEAEAGKIGSHRFVTYTANPERAVAKYLQLFFSHEAGLDFVRRASPGSAGRNRTLNLNFFIAQAIPLPPLSEQHWIVARVEAIASRVAEARQLKASTNATTQQFWKILSRLARETSSPLRTLGEIVDFLDGERVPLNETQRATRKGPYPYYGASGIIDHIDGYLFDEPLLLLSEDGANLVNRTTPIAFIARGRYWVNNHAHVLKPKPAVVDLDFLCYALCDYDVSIFNFASAQAKLNQANARRIALPVPPLPEQRAMVARLDALRAKIEPLAPLQAATATDLDALLPAVLNEAFAGRL